MAFVAASVALSARGRACERCECPWSDDAQIRSAKLVVVARPPPPKRFGAICEVDDEIQGDSTTVALLVPAGDGAYRPLPTDCASIYLAVAGKKVVVDGRGLTFDEFISNTARADRAC